MEENRKMIDGKLYIYIPEDDMYLPKYKMSNGLRMELDEEHFVYVLEGDSIDESNERFEDEESENYDLSSFYGKARAEFLREAAPDTYSSMKFDGTLMKHLIEIDKQAWDMEEKLIEKYKRLSGVTEELKQKDQMEWVAQVNSIKHTVRGIVQDELIYTL